MRVLAVGFSAGKMMTASVGDIQDTSLRHPPCFSPVKVWVQRCLIKGAMQMVRWSSASLEYRIFLASLSLVRECAVFTVRRSSASTLFLPDTPLPPDPAQAGAQCPLREGAVLTVRRRSRVHPGQG